MTENSSQNRLTSINSTKCATSQPQLPLATKSQVKMRISRKLEPGKSQFLQRFQLKEGSLNTRNQIHKQIFRYLAKRINRISILLSQLRFCLVLLKVHQKTSVILITRVHRDQYHYRVNNAR